jgi:hypothetical protein
VTVEDIGPEGLQAGRGSEPQMAVAVDSTRGQAKEIFVAAQSGILRL